MSETGGERKESKVRKKSEGDERSVRSIKMLQHASKIETGAAYI